MQTMICTVSAHGLRFRCRIHGRLPKGVGASSNPLEFAQLEALEAAATAPVMACPDARGSGGMAVGRLGGACGPAVSDRRRACAGMWARAVRMHPIPLEGPLDQLLHLWVVPPARMHGTTTVIQESNARM